MSLDLNALIPQRQVVVDPLLLIETESVEEGDGEFAGVPLVTPDELVTHNVLAHADVHSQIDLKKAIRFFPCSEFDPTKFQSVRIKSLSGTISMFSTGKLQITGAKSVEEAKLALKRVAYRLKHRVKINAIKFSSFRAENILATLDLGFPINLAGLSRDPELIAAYEPSRFSAVVIRDPADTKVTVDVFGSGKVNLKGAVSLQNLCKAINKCIRIIAMYQVD